MGMGRGFASGAGRGALGREWGLQPPPSIRTMAALGAQGAGEHGLGSRETALC